jgi:hypothetical protein
MDHSNKDAEASARKWGKITDDQWGAPENTCTALRCRFI